MLVWYGTIFGFLTYLRPKVSEVGGLGGKSRAYLSLGSGTKNICGESVKPIKNNI